MAKMNPVSHRTAQPHRIGVNAHNFCLTVCSTLFDTVRAYWHQIQSDKLTTHDNGKVMRLLCISYTHKSKCSLLLVLLLNNNIIKGDTKKRPSPKLE